MIAMSQKKIMPDHVPDPIYRHLYERLPITAATGCNALPFQ